MIYFSDEFSEHYIIKYIYLILHIVQIISLIMENGIRDAVDLYVEQHTTPEDTNLSYIRRKTHLSTVMPRQLSGTVQGKLLEMISVMVNPEFILEVGTFTGYSAYCLQKGLKQGGMLHTIEIKEEYQPAIDDFFSRAGVSDKIILHIGDSAQVIPSLNITFDLAFIDGDKRDYPNCYKQVFDKVRCGGYILVDNVLWSDKVLDVQPENNLYTKGIKELNDFIVNDSRSESVMLPLRDGLTLVRKLSN